MGSDAAMSSAAQAPGFDVDAKKILKAYLDAGWTATSSTNSHMILRAPDGVTTTALCSRANGRTGKNAMAPLNRWLRTQKRAQKPQDKPKPVVRQPRKVGASDGRRRCS
jgi:predicted RNA binding protein YcfA (HicA-like mRNA interferase family)